MKATSSTPADTQQNVGHCLEPLTMNALIWECIADPLGLIVEDRGPRRTAALRTKWGPASPET